VTEADRAELRALAERPDSEIDYSDIPPTTEEQWAKRTPNQYVRQKVTVFRCKNIHAANPRQIEHER
jgi:uncharacterized protein YfaQ (DUF2300 family)